MTDLDLRSARIAIIGSGPSGLATAATLAQAGCKNITVYDRRTDPTAFEPDRAYSMVIYRNGQHFLKNCLSQFGERFFKEAVCQHIRVVNHISADGNVSVEHDVPASGPVYWILKTRFLLLLQQYVKEYFPHIQYVNADVEDVQIAQETSLKLKHHDGRAENVPLDLLIACDGSKSSIRSLMASRDHEVFSKNGMAIYSKNSGSTGLRHKGVTLNNMPIISAPGSPTQYAQPASIYYLYGERKHRAAEEVFDMMLLPVASNTKIKRRAALSVLPGHKLLSVRDVDEAFALFEANFPQLRIRELIDVDEMQTFVQTEMSTFPPIERPNSMVAHFKNGCGGGVMFVGDSAHSFPPDAAQGINAALVDVAALYDIVCNNASKIRSVREMLVQYEQARDEESWILCDLHHSAATSSYQHRAGSHWRFKQNKNVRRALWGLMPWLFSRDLDTLIRQGYTYAQVRRKNLVTKAAMALLATCVVVALPVAAIASSANSESDP